MRKFFATCLAVSISFFSAAQTIPNPPLIREAAPASANMSAERLTRIDGLFNEYVSKRWIAGATAIVVRNGKIVYFKAVGYDDPDKKTSLKRDAIYRIASQTKAITSVAVMMLFEEGKFMLDDPISDYIPEFKKPVVLDSLYKKDSSYTTVPAKREITIRDLLTHTSGIDYAEIGSEKMKAIYAKAGIPSGIGVEPGRLLATEMKKLGKMPLLHQPGAEFTYGLNTDLLGYLVEVVSGMSLNDFFRKKIFEPLGMNDTYFYLPKEKYNRLAAVSTEDSTGHLMLSQPVYQFFKIDYPKSAGTYYSGGAGLSSTAYDYAIFMQMLLNGGIYNGHRLLSRNAVRMMTMNQIGDLPFGDNKFGLGFQITTERGSTKTQENEGSFAWGGYFSTTYWADPKEKLVVQIMTQQLDNSHGGLFDKFRVLVYQAIAD